MPMNEQIVFDPTTLLTSEGTKRISFLDGEVIFSRGDDADAVFYIESGGVKLSYRSSAGKNRAIAILKPGEFFGVGCIAGQLRRRLTATAMTMCSAIRIQKKVMVNALYKEPKLADLFVSFLVDRNRHYTDGMLDHLLNSSEKRLMRTLLILSDLGHNDGEHITLPNISQEALAEMVGTTRPRINYFIHKLQRTGLIEYDGRIRLSVTKLKLALHSYQDQ
jgi:CRP/FNR family cyclic AMP-dependent transcriptional regulator